MYISTPRNAGNAVLEGIIGKIFRGAWRRTPLEARGCGARHPRRWRRKLLRCTTPLSGIPGSAPATARFSDFLLKQKPVVAYIFSFSKF